MHSYYSGGNFILPCIFKMGEKWIQQGPTKINVGVWVKVERRLRICLQFHMPYRDSDIPFGDVYHLSIQSFHIMRYYNRSVLHMLKQPDNKLRTTNKIIPKSSAEVTMCKTNTYRFFWDQSSQMFSFRPSVVPAQVQLRAQSVLSRGKLTPYYGSLILTVSPCKWNGVAHYIYCTVFFFVNHKI